MLFDSKQTVMLYIVGTAMRAEQRQPGQTEAAHRRRARPEKVYHVFTDRMDVWTGKRKKAEKVYRRFVRTNGVARLYEERYRDRENDEMLSETCLKSFGGYPL